MVGGKKWSCFELMRYLASVKDTLTETEMSRLKRTAAFPVEDPSAPSAEELLADPSKAKPIKRLTPDGLYEPTPEHRALKVDVLDWGSPWKPSSDEAKFAFQLGLRRKILLPQLISLAGHPTDSGVREKAMQYLLENLAHYNGFTATSFKDVAFIPAIAPDGKQYLAKPMEVYLNPQCSVMGFSVVAPIPNDGAKKLRCLPDVPTFVLAKTLVSNPPATVEEATKQFEYLATRIPGVFDLSFLDFGVRC